MQYRVVAVLLGLMMSFPSGAPAQELSTEEHADGFVSLFDGETLNGWRIEGATPDDWVVKDGAIWCSGARSWLRSELEFDDFILKVQWRFLKEKGNSGIYIRATGGLGEKTPPRETTHQVQTFDGPPAGMIFLGGLSARPKPNSLLKPAKPEGGEWNEFEIACQGPSISVKLNGDIVSQTTESKLARGFIGFEGEGAPIEFRNLRIKELGFDSLFVGNSLHGWELMNGGQFAAEDSVIKLHGGRGWLRHARALSDFVLRMDVRFMKPNQDSGVFVRASREGGNWPDKGYQVQTMNNASMGAIFGAPHKRDAALVTKVLRGPEEWNTYDIECIGKKIHVRLNGELAATCEAAERPWGYIGLQGEGGELEFRNIRVREILPVEEGFTNLFHGTTLEGWHGDRTRWSVQCGAIRITPPGGGNLYHSSPHGRNCVIRLQFRAAEKGADSGVFIHGKQLQVRDYANAGPKEYAFAANPYGVWNDLEFDITDGIAVVKCNGQVIEKAWQIGGDSNRGIGLQSERGVFEFRHIRIKEK